MDDTPLSEAGYWSTYDAEADIRATMGEAGFAQGWALAAGHHRRGGERAGVGTLASAAA